MLAKLDKKLTLTVERITIHSLMCLEKSCIFFGCNLQPHHQMAVLTTQWSFKFSSSTTNSHDGATSKAVDWDFEWGLEKAFPQKWEQRNFCFFFIFLRRCLFRQLNACQKELCYSSGNFQLSHISHSEGETRIRDTSNFGVLEHYPI